MYIYKITNKINNKIYIGQTYGKTIEDRFKRHISDANMKSPIVVDRAIHKYGKQNFICELIDTANNIEELNQKEIYWIKYYNSTDTKIGYNCTTGGNGGNTYLNKSIEELEIIKKKLSDSKLSYKNPNARKIKCLDTYTNTITIFDSVADVSRHFNTKNSNIVFDRCLGKSKCLYKERWNFTYDGNDFYNYPKYKIHPRSPIVKTINKETGEILIHYSLSKLCRYLNTPIKCYNDIINKFKNIYVFENVGSVSTIPDECKEVGSEISTDSKRKTID